jgi:Mg-chelatase subunit ChlD
VDEKSQPSSARALIRLRVRGGKNDGVRERVYLRQLPSGKVYSSRADDQGQAWFLIPNKYVYLVDFRYQKDVDAINLLHASDLTSGALTIQYSPDPRLEYPETFIPTPENLLLRNFNDFLEKQFAHPKDKPFNIELKSVRRIHRNAQEALFMLTLAGAESGNVRLPLNVAFVLDKSGSMFSNNRSEALKGSLMAIGAALSSKDIVSIVLFDDQAYEVQQNGTNPLANLREVADNYSPSGGTNIFEGLKQGEKSILRQFDKNKSNKVILLTDGYDSTPPGEITDYVQAKFKEGIEFSTIGLGTDYNQSLLELIAMKGNGTFNYVDSAMMLSDAFLKEVKGSFSYSARDLKIEIFHNEKLIFSNLYGYPVVGKSNKSITFEIGKIPYGTNRIAFIKFKLNAPSPELQNQPLQMKVTYFDLAKQQNVTYQEQIKLEWTDETDTELKLDQEERKLYAIAILNQSMKSMADAYALNKPEDAKNALLQGVKQVEEVFPDARPKDVQSLFDEVKRYVDLFIQIEKNTK